MLHYPFVTDFLNQSVEKAWMGGPKVKFRSLMSIQCRLFETGAIMGRIFRSALPAFAKTFSEPGMHRELAGHIGERAKERLALYRRLSGEEPDSLFRLFLLTELEGKVAPRDAIHQWKNKKVDLQYAYSMCVLSMVEGIGLGALYPGETASMWNSSWGSVDPEVWGEARDAGLMVEQPAQPVGLEEREGTIRQGVTIFVAAYYPELVKPLKLS